MKRISIKSCITEVVDITDPTILNIMPTLVRWGIRADQQIGSYNSYIDKIVRLDITNCKAQIPCDAVLIRHVLLGGYDCDCDLFNSNKLLINSDEFDITQGDMLIDHAYYWNDLNNICVSDISWHIEGDCIKFDYDYDGEEATILYKAYETDKEGIPLVNESHREAIMYYILVKLDEREEWNLKKKGRLNNAFYYSKKDNEKKMRLAVRKARALDGEPTETERFEISELVNNPLTGYGNYMLENLRG